ncbi:MAG: DUF1566 domain-containing protein [Chitinophagaceae bacterium]|nr:MAG: DUF1566 domain-containing protein [Chitinophagaceae bacterium]
MRNVLFFLPAIFLIVFSNNSTAQNITICAGDTVTLEGIDYKQGDLQWQYSTDSTDWFDMVGETQLTTLAQPLESTWYRLMITDEECLPPFFTEIKLIEVLEVAETPAISTNSPVCAGETLSLFADSHAGITYQWSGPDGFSSTDQNPVVSSFAQVSMTGEYTLVVISNNGCESIEEAISLIVNDTPGAPVVNSNSPICEGETLNLFSDEVIGANYNWSGPNGFNSTNQNPVVSSSATASMSGDYELIVEVDGCSSNAASVNIDINLTPAAPTAELVSPACLGENLILNADGQINGSIFWSGPSGFQSNQQSPTVSNSATSNMNGLYEVFVVENGCTSSISSVNVVLSSLPNAPTSANHTPGIDNIEWNWNSVSNASAYSYNTTNDFSSATNNGPNTSFTQTGLTCDENHTLYVWATNDCGESSVLMLNQQTSDCSITPPCTPGLSVGTNHGGGVIANTNYSNGQCNYLIAASADQSAGAPWGCQGTNVNTSTAVGTGQSNTDAILNACPTQGIAARICDELVEGGFDDWFLPSKDELNILRNNQNIIGGFNHGMNSEYWSSSQGGSNSNAWQQWFDFISGQNQYLKNDTYRVRCVRSY